MLKIIELFSGIRACSKALERLGIEYECVDSVEIDKYAIKSQNAMFNTNFEPQDITTWDKDLEVDLIFHGSPCQDFSLAGRQAGGDIGSGTRSSLLYETVRIVQKLKPKYVIWENVKNVLSQKHRHNFDMYLAQLEELGYKSYYQVLNAKDYGIPQNRERVFTISILGEHDSYVFPQKQELKLRLKDMLEDEVDEKYYISNEKIDYMLKTNFVQSNFDTVVQNENDICSTLCARDYKDPKCVQVGNLNIKGNDQIKRIYSEKGLCPTLTDMQGGNRQPKILIPEATAKGYAEAEEGDGVYINRPHQKRGCVQSQMIQTIKTSLDVGVVCEQRSDEGLRFFKDNICGSLRTIDSGRDKRVIENNLRIRKLTPKECWRLMGFDDEDYEKAAKVCSNSQLYKQAGNSIVVQVLEAIFRELLYERIDISRKLMISL